MSDVDRLRDYYEASYPPTVWGGGVGPSTASAGFDPADHTVDDVKSYVEDHPDELNDVLDAEQSGKNRVTLVDWLTEQQPDEESE